MYLIRKTNIYFHIEVDEKKIKTLMGFGVISPLKYKLYKVKIGRQEKDEVQFNL